MSRSIIVLIEYKNHDGKTPNGDFRVALALRKNKIADMGG
jgi:hypothetical protein